jgi:site-specific recombinase XerD
MKTDHYLAQYVRAFFQDHLICRRNMADGTVRSYRDAIKLFLQFVAKRNGKPACEVVVTDLERSTIMDFLTYLEVTRQNSIQTRNHRLTVLRHLLGYIAAEEPLLSDHCRKARDIPAKRGVQLPEITYLEKEEMAAMLRAIDDTTVQGRRDRALLEFMYNTGARAQETADARLSWVSFHPPYKVEILGKGRKRRTCPLWKGTAEALRRLVTDERRGGDEDPYLFLNRLGQPLSRFGIWSIISKYRDKAALKMPTLRRKAVTPHTIRHTTAMHLLQSGVDINVIRGWLGHANLKTTHRYAEIDLAMKAKALKRCEPTVKGVRLARWRQSQDILRWLESL